MRWHIPSVVLLCLALASCGKPTNSASGADPCANVKGVAPYETDAQAVEACRDNKKFSGPDAKRSNIQISNH